MVITSFELIPQLGVSIEFFYLGFRSPTTHKLYGFLGFELSDFGLILKDSILIHTII